VPSLQNSEVHIETRQSLKIHK